MTPSIILSVAGLLTFGLLCFMTWRIYYRDAGTDTHISAGFVFIAFVCLAVSAAMAAAGP